jgi:hypothetical protein
MGGYILKAIDPPLTSIGISVQLLKALVIEMSVWNYLNAFEFD